LTTSRFIAIAAVYETQPIIITYCVSFNMDRPFNFLGDMSPPQPDIFFSHETIIRIFNF
jgi:hypothetical protein